MKFLELLFQKKSPLAKLIGIGLKTLEGEVKIVNGSKTFVAPYLIQANCLLAVYQGTAPNEQERGQDGLTFEDIALCRRWCDEHTDLLLEVLAGALLDQCAQGSMHTELQMKAEELICRYRDALIASHGRIDDLKVQLQNNAAQSAAHVSRLNAAIARLKADLSTSGIALDSHHQHIQELTGYVQQLEANLHSALERQSSSESSDNLLKNMAVGGLSGYALGRLLHQVK